MSKINWTRSGEIIQFFPWIGHSHLAEASYLSFLSCFPRMATSPVFHAFSKREKRKADTRNEETGQRGIKTFTSSTYHVNSLILLVIRWEKSSDPHSNPG
jgi:hypothetical protein